MKRVKTILSVGVLVGVLAVGAAMLGQQRSANVEQSQAIDASTQALVVR